MFQINQVGTKQVTLVGQLATAKDGAKKQFQAFVR